MCSGSEAGSYSRLTDFVYHPTLGLRVLKKKKIICRLEGRYKATWKRLFELPWREAGLLKLSR